MALTKDAILAATDLQRETVAVPEWGGDVIVTTMSGVARDAYESSMVVEKDGRHAPDLSNLRAKLVAATLIDEAGNLLFSGPDEVAALASKSAAVLERLFIVAQRLNGLGFGAIEAAEKN